MQEYFVLDDGGDVLGSLGVDFVGKQIQLLKLGVILDGQLQLLQEHVIHVTGIEG